jgi:hypothetical protein
MSSPGTSSKPARDASLRVLPIVGTAGLLLGAMTLAGVRFDLERYLPIVTVALGAAALWASFGSFLLESFASRRTPRSESTGPRNAPRAAGWVGHHRAVDGPHHRAPSPRSGVGRVVASAASHAEEELWGHWASPTSTSLGVALVGPVRETAYSPPTPRSLAAFPTMDDDILFLSESLNARSAIRSDETDHPPLSRPLEERPRWVPRDLADARRPASAARPSPQDSLDEPPRPSSSWPAEFGEGGSIAVGRPGLLPILDSMDSPEVSHLPLLEPTVPVPRAWMAAGQPQGPSPGRSSPLVRLCRDCSRHLSDFREWVHCRGCQEPVCKDCLDESFSRDDRGLCASCRESPRRPRVPEPTARLRFPSDPDRHA